MATQDQAALMSLVLNVDAYTLKGTQAKPLKPQECCQMNSIHTTNASFYGEYPFAVYDVTFMLSML